MSPLTVAPLGAALALAMLVGATHKRLPPALSARLLAVTYGSVILAAVPTLWVVSLEFLLHMPALGAAMRRGLESFGLSLPSPDRHRPVPAWIGLVAVVVSLGGVARLGRVMSRLRRLRPASSTPFAIADTDEAFAVTLPGRGGQVVVSRGLIDLLDGDELRVVLAHENVHASHRHDRYVFLEQVGVALVPLLEPLSRWLRFSLERWADEETARTCGDRAFVARTLGKVALHGVEPSPALGFGALGTIGRVTALLGPPPAAPRRLDIAMTGTAIGFTCVLAIVQLHHLEAIVRLLCPN